MPGESLKGRKGQTTYNACDTTALFLIAAEGLIKADKERGEAFVGHNQVALEKAARYIVRHLTDQSLFEERPPEGAKGFNLRATYWKDSVLSGPWFKREPTYPVIYPQAHFVAARGLLAASRVLAEQPDDLPNFADTAHTMFINGIAEFMRPDGYVAYRDKRRTRKQASSDELHSLAYIPARYTQLLPLEAIQKRAKELETPFGYLCTPMKVKKTRRDRYHVNTIWPPDNAFIHYETTKHGLPDEAEVAAREYFAGRSLLRLVRWL